MTKPENEKVHKVEPHSLEKNSNIGKQYIIIGFILNVSVLEFYDLRSTRMSEAILSEHMITSMMTYFYSEKLRGLFSEVVPKQG